MPINDMTGFDRFGIADIPASRIEINDQIMLPGEPSWSPVRDVSNGVITIAAWFDGQEVRVEHSFSDDTLLRVRRAPIFDIDEPITFTMVDDGTSTTLTTRDLLS